MILIYNSILGLRYTIILANLRDSVVVDSTHLYSSIIGLHSHKIIKYYVDYDTYSNAPADRAEIIIRYSPALRQMRGFRDESINHLKLCYEHKRWKYYKFRTNRQFC